VTPTDIATLFDHLYFVRDLVLDAGNDDSVPFVDPAPPTTRDLRSTLVHELDVEWSWRVRLASRDRTRFNDDDEELEPSEFGSIAAIRERWQADEAEMREWLATLSEEDLVAPCRTEPDGGRHPFWFHLVHLYSHGLQQLADAATILSAVERSPGELDFLEFVEKRLDLRAPQRDVAVKG
jgi:hypothetical protein